MSDFPRFCRASADQGDEWLDKHGRRSARLRRWGQLMEDWFRSATKVIIAAIEAMALVIISIATVEAFFAGLWAAFARSAASRQVSAVWLRFDRWLVAALSFLLAADIIGTLIAPTWQEVAQVGAIAVIRTFLNYFLGRDMDELRKRDAESIADSRVSAGKGAAGSD